MHPSQFQARCPALPRDIPEREGEIDSAVHRIALWWDRRPHLKNRHAMRTVPPDPVKPHESEMVDCGIVRRT